MLKKLLILATLLFSPLLQAEEEPRAFYELLYGTGTRADANITTIGIGLRFTFPINDNVYFGYKGDASYSSEGGTGFIYHLAFSLDVRLHDDLFLTGDVGHAWGYQSILDENNTYVLGYSDIPSAEGGYFTAGLRYQFSEYVEAAVLYRNTLYNPVEGSAHFVDEELVWSLNFAITEESLHFFHFLGRLGENSYYYDD